MAKLGDQSTVKVGGEEYTLQHPGTTWVLQAEDECKNRFGVIQQNKFVKKIFNNVIIKPNDINIDDLEFEDFKELMLETKSFLGIKS